MKAKDIENKIKALYANVEPGWNTKKDTILIKDAMHSDRMKQQIKKVKQGSNIEYKFLVRSPAKNLMYLYDKHADILNKTFLPSTIYHYRYEHQYPAELAEVHVDDLVELLRLELGAQRARHRAACVVFDALQAAPKKICCAKKHDTKL